MANQPQGSKGTNGKQAAPPPRPFRIGVKSHEEINYDQTVTLLTTTQDLTVLEVPPAGFLRGLLLLVEATSANT